jgi:hypothetical protein
MPAHAATVKPAASSIPFIGVESKDIAGYQEGRYTRQITATFNLPTNNQCAKQFYPRSPAGDGFALTLGPAEESNAGVPFSHGAASTVGLSFVPNPVTGCGLISPSFASNTPTYTSAAQFGATPGMFLPGDSVTLTLGYSQGGEVTWATVTDNTVAKSVHSTFPGKYTYVSGSATAGFGPFTPAGASVKLWAIKNVSMATYTGHLGALGAFKPTAIEMTSDGTTAGVVYSFPKALWNAGRNFSIIGD